MDKCICCSDRFFAQCCQPILDGQPATTAEALMRSRYSAFCLGKVDYIYLTMSGKALANAVRQETEEFIDAVEWLGLEVIESSQKTQHDDTASVEFIAYYSEEGKTKQLHEKSQFCKENGRWFYVDGEHVVNSITSKSVGRNDLCPCGSNKKFKKCCL